MNRIFRNDGRKGSMEIKVGDLPFDPVIEPAPQGNRWSRFPWLVAGVFIFALLYCTSYLALLWLPPYKGVDMRSQLTADYSAWAYVVFQPVDPAILEEIRQEKGLPEDIIIDGSSWPVATSTDILPAITGTTSTPMPQATVNDPLPGPTASQLFSTTTSIPTTLISPPAATVTVVPAGTSAPTIVLQPTRTPKSQRTPKPKTPKPPRTPKP